MRLQVMFLTILLVCTATAFAGCSSVTQIPAASEPSNHYSAVQATLLGENDHWDLSRGCYYTVNYQVYNIGNTTARNVRLDVELVHANDNALRDSKEVFVGSLEPGTSSTVAVELDGECLRDYNTRAVPVYDV
jgi:uncharacterized membrane protein